MLRILFAWNFLKSWKVLLDQIVVIIVLNKLEIAIEVRLGCQKLLLRHDWLNFVKKSNSSILGQRYFCLSNLPFVRPVSFWTLINLCKNAICLII